MTRLIYSSRPSQNPLKLTRLMNGKMLTFTKISLASYMYGITDVVSFHGSVKQGLSSEAGIMKCLPYHLLTDTDSASFLYVFACKVDCSITEDNRGGLVFENLLTSKLQEQLDLSEKFWAKFCAQDACLKNWSDCTKLGL